MVELSETRPEHGSNSNWRQFWVLLWKHTLLQKKKTAFQTCAMLIYLIIFAVILIIVRSFISPKFSPNATTYSSFTVTPTFIDDLPFPPLDFVLAHFPNTTLVTRIMHKTATIMGVKNPTSAYLGFASESDVEDYLAIHQNVFGAVVFLDAEDWISLPQKITYKIRLRSDQVMWSTSDMFGQEHTIAPRELNDKFGGKHPGYYYRGFLAIQSAVDLSLIAEVNKSFEPTTTATIQLQRYPYPPYRADAFIPLMKTILPLFYMTCFMSFVSAICQEIVLEKENKFKESMRLMGMSTWVYWSSWFVKYLLLMLIGVILLTILFHASISPNGPVIAHSSPTVILLFLFLYSLSVITFSFAVTTLVFKAVLASSFGYLLFFLMLTPFFYLMRIYDDMTLGQKFASSLDFNLAMGFGCIKIAQYEDLGIGVQWNNLWSSAYKGDDYVMGHIMIMLLVDTIIYSIITWYLDAVIPGDFGTAQPFNFPFRKEYWMSRRGDKIKLLNDNFMTLVPDDKRPYFETPLQDAKAGIQIRGLTKNFGSNTNPAVNNLNIDIYKGNITVLVGHNGAGKTTAMFMLTGFLHPSKGTAFINGFDITREMDEIRQNIGFCPQHNVLMDFLTVGDHLRFFAVLKGSSMKNATSEMNEMIKVLHLEEKINAEATTLSGGEKRKLSVGIALISGSKVLILDEPTSGMDPEARRQTWDILQSQRKDRTIILSTHYMDEADILGDRIAIMSNGEIQCYGTPMFLKNKYGVGYHLTVVKSSTCDVDQLRDVISSKIPLVRVVRDETEEVTFILPSNQSSKFEGLFVTLETDGKTLGIDSFGVSVTTMEEVFLKVTDSSTLEGGPRIDKATDAEKLGNISNVGVPFRKEIGWKRHNLQLRAMFYKRIIHSIRNYEITLCQILIPVIFTIVVCLTKQGPSKDDHLRPLTLNLSHFKNSITPYDVRNTTANALKLSTCFKTSISRQSDASSVLISAEPGYSTMDDYLKMIGKESKDEYDWTYQIGATIDEEPNERLNITGFFNNQAYHTIAISLSYLGNSLMQCFGDKDYQIETINHPLPKNSSTRASEAMSTINEFYFSYTMSLGLYFLFPTFLIFLIKERKSGAKHSQLVSGVRLDNFWLATFIWDFVNYLVPCILIIVVILSFRIDGYWQHSWVIFIGFIAHGFSMLPFIYLMSFLFGEASVGFSWVFFICMITGLFASFVILLLESSASRSTWQTVELIVCILFPTYDINAVFQNIDRNHKSHVACSKLAKGAKLSDICSTLKRLGNSHPCCPGNCGGVCVEVVDNYLSWTFPGVGRPLVFMVLQGIAFFLILFIIETDMFGRIYRNERAYMCLRQLTLMIPARVTKATLAEMNAEKDGKISEDSDVANERQRISSNPIQELAKTDPLVIHDLTKLYGNFMAVNQLSLEVSQKECFGLLGVNGAGKTTVFKMLTGEIWPSFGKAYIAGISLQDDLAEVRQKIGYCAQFDSIIDQMTVRETLWMYACAHGIPDQVRQEVIDRLIEQMTLKPYTNIRAGKLSGGNRRKLCVAVALMGNPTVVFLDEPTTGVDPEARRHVWNTLADARNAGTTIILTSHSMEECEAICTRMGILVNGRFLCLGSLQHLRDKFSDGYTLTIKLKRSADTETPEQQQERIEKLKTFISQTFPQSVLKDQHENLLNYEVKTRVIKWSEIFEVMERAKVTHEIEDYSVGQTTLEQLFIGFARMQRKPREISR